MATQIEVTDADLAALIQAAKATLEKIDAAVDAVKNLADMARTQDIPNAQASIQEIADAAKKFAAKTFNFSGPMGIHGQSS